MALKKSDELFFGANYGNISESKAIAKALNVDVDMII